MAKVIKKFAKMAARKFIEIEIKRQAGKSPTEAFRAAWKRLLSNPIYCRLMRVNEHPTKEGLQLRGKTYDRLAFGIPNFFKTGQIKISDNLEKAIASGEPFLAVHLHDGFRFFDRPFLERGRDVARVVADPPRYTDMMRRLGFDLTCVHPIKDGMLSLVHLREAAGNKNVLIVALDYKSKDQSYLNPAAFGFAYRRGIPVYFCKTHVDENGNPEIISDGPYLGVDPISCAEKFLDFFNSTGTLRASLTIKRYVEHDDWNSNKGYR